DRRFREVLQCSPGEMWVTQHLVDCPRLFWRGESSTGNRYDGVRIINQGCRLDVLLWNRALPAEFYASAPSNSIRRRASYVSTVCVSSYVVSRSMCWRCCWNTPVKWLHARNCRSSCGPRTPTWTSSTASTPPSKDFAQL